MNQELKKIFDLIHPGVPFGYQVDWAEDGSKYKLAVKARQIGITTTEAVKTFLEALFWKESESQPKPPAIAFCSPSQRQSTRLMQYIQRSKNKLTRVYDTNVELKKERDDYILFENFAEIWSLPNNPRTIEGLDISKGIIDEIGNFTGREDREVYEAMMASLAAQGGGITIFGKPRGRRGLFWELFNPYGDYAKQFSIHEFPYQARAKHDPVYAAAVSEHKLRLSPLAFAENYECAFIDETVVVFPWEIIDRQVKDFDLWSLRTNIPSDFPIYIGIDFGKKESKTAVSVVEHTPDGTFLRFHKTYHGDFSKQKIELIEVINHFRALKVLVDKTGMGIPLTDDLTAVFGSKVEGIQFSSQSKEKMILSTRNLMEDGRLFIPDVKELKDQLHGIEKTVLESGRIKYTGKQSETEWLDDRAFSLFLACSQLGEGEFTMTIVDQAAAPKISEYEKWAKDLDDDGNAA